MMSKFAWAWTWLAFLVVIDVVIPWFVLNRVEKLSGSFLFWTIWAAVAIASAFLIFLKWREVER
jgi:hypothetical protein